jgi:phosphoglycolate phosphatase-like HAD superfamily hydrolase
MAKPVIALDADGVLLDYNLAYASAWQRAFGNYPAEKDTSAYWALDRWDVARLEADALNQLRSAFDTSFWSSLPALPGAIEACNCLVAAGYELVCVTALSHQYGAARQCNLKALGFPIVQVHTADEGFAQVNPKAELINALKPVAFADDYLPFLAGIGSHTHCALIHRRATKTPNIGESLEAVASQHADLLEFAHWWVANPSKLN